MAERAVRKKAPQPTDKHVGSRIRMRRRMLDITQEGLAAVIGITFQQIQKYENGTNRVGAGRLQQIADALDCSVAWFFEERPGSPRPGSGAAGDADLSAFFADAYATDVVRGFAKLPPRVKRAFAKVIAAAAERH